VERTHDGAGCEEVQPVRRTHIDKGCEGLSPVGGTPAGAGEEHEEEGATETTCDELIATSCPHPLHHCGEGGREALKEAESGKMGGVGGKVFLDLFLFLVILFSYELTIN